MAVAAGEVLGSDDAAVVRSLVSSTTGASLLTPDMMHTISQTTCFDKKTKVPSHVRRDQMRANQLM